MIVEILNCRREDVYYDILREFMGPNYVLRHIDLPLEVLEEAEDETMSHVTRVIKELYMKIAKDLTWKFIQRECSVDSEGMPDGDYFDTYEVIYNESL